MGAIYISADHPPSLAAEMFIRGQGAEYLIHRDSPEAPWPANVWSFANTSISHGLLQGLGSFDERFRMREDGELGVRLLKAGVRQHFIANAVAYQWCEKSAEELVRDAEAFAQYDLLYVQKHPGWMPHTFLTQIRNEGRCKRAARRLLADHLKSADAFLAPLSAMGERRHIPRPLRQLAIRALQLQCGLHWYRRISELSGAAPEGPATRRS
jgi:GT2 family glycosyltransferase